MCLEPTVEGCDRIVWTGGKNARGYAEGDGRLKCYDGATQIAEFGGLKRDGSWVAKKEFQHSEWAIVTGSNKTKAERDFETLEARLATGDPYREIVDEHRREMAAKYGEAPTPPATNSGGFLSLLARAVIIATASSGGSGGSSSASSPSSGSSFKQRYAGNYTDFRVTYDGMDRRHFVLGQGEHNYLVLRSASGDRISVRYSGALQSGSGPNKASLEGTTISVRFNSSGEPGSLKNTSNGRTAYVTSWGLE